MYFTNTLTFLKKNLPLSFIMEYSNYYLIDGIVKVTKGERFSLKDHKYDYKLNDNSIKILKTYLKENNIYKQVFQEDYLYKDFTTTNTDYLYFLILKDTVKIGRAKNVKERISGLSTAIPDNFIVYFIENKGDFEKTLHNCFKEFHKKGEWFLLNDRIKQFINNYANPEYLTNNFIFEEKVLSTLVLPSGKYKNELLKDILIKDKNYCKWLCSTDIFSKKVNNYIKDRIYC